MRKERSFLPLAAPLTLLVAGCGAGENTAPTLHLVVPPRAYSDSSTAIHLLGGSFHPPVQVDTYSGSADLAAAQFQVSFDPARPMDGRRPVAGIDPTWINDRQIDTTLPPGLAAGLYSVSLRDAAGNSIPSSAMFTSLGPDIDPPHIVFLQPSAGAAFAPGDTINVAVRVDDGAGRVRGAQWSVSSPALPPQGPTAATNACNLDPTGRCDFPVTAVAGPDALDPIDITVVAQDTVNNQGSAYLRVYVASQPTITSIDPPQASTAGGITITVFGQSFVAGISQVSIDGVPVDGVVDSTGTQIQTYTVEHVPGTASVVVSNGDNVSAAAPLTFIPPPILKLIDPSHAVVTTPTVTIDIAGNNFRPETEFFWIQGGKPQQLIAYADPANLTPQAPYERLISSNRAELTLNTVMGTISIFAHDPVSGDSELVDAFTFDPPP